MAADGNRKEVADWIGRRAEICCSPHASRGPSQKQGALGGQFQTPGAKTWGGDINDKFARAEAFLDDLPQYGDAFRGAAARKDWRAVVDLLIFAEKTARESGLDDVQTGYSTEPEPPLSSPTDRIQVQREIDLIYRENPPGTREHTSPEVQGRLQALFATLHGDGPIVGRGNRVL